MKARTLISIAMCAPICALTLCADPVWRYWAAGDDGAKLNDAKAWNPNGVPGAEDTLGVTIGTNKPARVEAGDDLTVNNLYVGWGRKYDADGTHISDDAANDLGGRLDVSGGILNVLSSLTVGGGWADNNDAVMNVAGGRVNAASLFTGDCGSWSGKKDTINISGSGTVFAVGGGDVRFSNFSGGTTFVSGKAHYKSSSPWRQRQRRWHNKPDERRLAFGDAACRARHGWHGCCRHFRRNDGADQ